MGSAIGRAQDERWVTPPLWTVIASNPLETGSILSVGPFADEKLARCYIANVEHSRPEMVGMLTIVQLVPPHSGAAHRLNPNEFKEIA